MGGVYRSSDRINYVISIADSLALHYRGALRLDDDVHEFMSHACVAHRHR